MKISLNFPETLLAKLDTYCAEHDYERSELVRSLVRDLLQSPVEKVLNSAQVTDKYTSKVIESISEVSKIADKVSQLGSISTADKINPPRIGYCKLHFSEKGPVTLVTWEDENGTPIIDKQMICDVCLEKYKNIGRGKLYIL